MPWHTCGSERICRSWLLPSATWVLGVKLRSSGMAACAVTDWAISPAPLSLLFWILFYIYLLGHIHIAIGRKLWESVLFMWVLRTELWTSGLMAHLYLQSHLSSLLVDSFFFVPLFPLCWWILNYSKFLSKNVQMWIVVKHFSTFQIRAVGK